MERVFERYGLQLNRPVFMNGLRNTDQEVREQFLNRCLQRMVNDETKMWSATQSGDCTVYVMRRDRTFYIEEFHIIIFHGMETYCCDMTYGEALEYSKSIVR